MEDKRNISFNLNNSDKIGDDEDDDDDASVEVLPQIIQKPRQSNSSSTSNSRKKAKRNSIKAMRRRRRFKSLVRSKKVRAGRRISEVEKVFDTKAKPWQQVFADAGFQPIPYILKAQKLIIKYFWLFAALLLTAAAIAHTYYICYQAWQGNQLVKEEYPLLGNDSNVDYPPFVLCFPSTFGFNTSLIDNHDLLNFAEATLQNMSVNDTFAKNKVYLLSLLKMVPVLNIPDQIKVKSEPNNQIYSKDMSTFYNQFVDFSNTFAMKCNNHLFIKCSIGESEIDCCNIVEPVFHLEYGWCYRNNRSRMPKISGAEQFSLLSIEISGVDKAMLILGSNGYEQGQSEMDRYNYRLNSPSNNIWIIEQELLSDESGQQNCVINDKLKYFNSYTPGNCITERVYFKNSSTKLNCSILLWNLLLGKMPTDMLKQSCDQNQVQQWLNDYYKAKTNQTEDIQSICRPLCQRWIYRMQYLQQPVGLEQLNQNNSSILIKLTFPFQMFKHTSKSSPMGFVEYGAMIGGNLNLWLGCSLVSFIYIAVTFFDKMSAAKSLIAVKKLKTKQKTV